jgi:hypothetical protein
LSEQSGIGFEAYYIAQHAQLSSPVLLLVFKVLSFEVDFQAVNPYESAQEEHYSKVLE